jgi:hypothetical protein
MVLDWAEKWEEYCEALDSLALARSKLNYMDRVEKRMFAVVYREATGTVKERETAFYASVEYKEFLDERTDVDTQVQRLYAKRDQLSAWFDLYRTDESSRREEMRLQR